MSIDKRLRDIRFKPLTEQQKRILRMIDSYVDTNDGGPGSGNWGHKGRAGKVGGSGKGGGKHYRGGRGDIGYMGSREDWLNGLTGERQHEAEKLMKQIPKFAKNRSVAEAEKEIMDGKTSRVDSKVRKDKTAFLRFKGEARNWTDADTRDKLINENLSDEDKEALKYFDAKYGVEDDGNDYEAMLKDGTIPKDEYDYYLDLKSKAMDGPDSGTEMPEAVKEFVTPGDPEPEPTPEPEPEPQPEPEPEPEPEPQPEPEPEPVPKKIGYDWMKKAPRWDNADSELRDFLDTGYSSYQRFPADIALNDELRDEAEQEITTQLALAYPNYEHGVNSDMTTKAFAYLGTKGRYLEGDLNWTNQCSNRKFPLLSEEESKEMDKLLSDLENDKIYGKGKSDYDFIQNNGYLVIGGEGMMRLALLKAKALGLPEPQSKEQQAENRKNRNKIKYRAAAEICNEKLRNSSADRKDMIDRGSKKSEERKNGGHPRDTLCQTAYSFGSKHYERTAAIVDKCQDEDVQHVWDCYERDLRVVATKGVDGAFYSPYRKGISLSIIGSARGNTYEEPYGVVFHEFGHNIDYLAAKRTGLGDGIDNPFSYLYNGGEFPGTLKEEFASLKQKWTDECKQFVKEKGVKGASVELFGYERDEMNFYNEESMYDSMTREYIKKKVFGDLSPRQKADISDMLEANIGSSYSLGFGHGGGYWSGKNCSATEAFAEMYSATMNNPASLEVIKKYVPNSYACFKRMMKFITTP